MNRSALVALSISAFASFALGGCLALGLRQPREEDFCGEGRPGEVRCAAYEVLNCSTRKIEVVEARDFWRATGCGKEAHCDTQRRNWVCELAPTSEDRARAALAVTSGCPNDQMKIVASAPSADGYATFRIEACGAVWVCPVTEATATCGTTSAPPPKATAL